MLFTGKHRSSCEHSHVCAINNQACFGYTAHRCDIAYTWQDLPLASFSNKWKTMVILSQISGGKPFCTSHKSSDKCSKENYKAQISYKTSFWSLFILTLSCCLHLFWTASYWTIGMITRHSTQGIQGRFIFCWESGQKRSLCQC